MKEHPINYGIKERRVWIFILIFKMKKIIIYGGVFNPPLNSHFFLAEQVLLEFKDAEKIIFVPVNNEYKKNSMLGANHRYNMLKLICDENEKFEVSRLELDSDRPLYTVETLRLFKEMYAQKEILFMTGTDNLKELSTWKYAEELLNEFKIIILQRGLQPIQEIIYSEKFLLEHKNSFIIPRDGIVTNLSSTYIRERIRNGESIRYLVPEKIISYIYENRLYGGK